MSHSTTKPCDRCGRAIQINVSRPQPPVRCCSDCRESDREWLRMVGAA